MPEGRDRLSRNEDVMTMYNNLRRRNAQRGDAVISILEDDRQATGTPFRWRDIPMVGSPGPTRVIIGTPESRHRPQFYRTPRYVGRENLSPVVGGNRRGRGRSELPSWYPRKPLQDITAVVRAIERRRARLGVSEGLLRTPIPVLQDRIVYHDSTTPSTSGGYPLTKRDISTISPHSSIQRWRGPQSIGKVPKILLDITNKADGDSDCLTPQKKLLNNIDIVEKRVMEELRKVKRTPSARKAEREKKVRTLMSMR